jgi:hypothetical protein
MKYFYPSFVLVMLVPCLLLTNAQAPVLNSFPSAKPVIFLDFDGHTVEGTSWNKSGPIYCAPSNLSPEQIAEVFNRVSEDFRPFNINITTDSTLYHSAPLKQRMRVILTVTSEWYSSNAGGVAFTNSFSWGDNTPCFVFTALHRYNIKNISESVSHETGHTLGLYHQAAYNGCTKTSEYNWGTGSGEIGWAPIMGGSYGQNLTLWHNGPTPYECNNFQSDLDIITGSLNGFGFRADDHSASYSSATVAAFSNNQFTASGVISRTDDKDLFKFEMPAYGRLQLDAIPYNVGALNTGSNLDLNVDLINASQTIIGTYNPSTLLNSFLDTVLNPGTYYLMIDGQGNEFANEYGSLGAYSVQGQFTAMISPDSPPPTERKTAQIILNGSAQGNKHKLSWNIDANENVGHQYIERAENSGSFVTIAQPAADARSYDYAPDSKGTYQYRLKVFFDNASQFYSNEVTLGFKGGGRKPKLISNVIYDNSIMVNSHIEYNYSITYINGRVITKGKVREGTSTIQTGNISKGTYLITFFNDSEYYSEKFVKL